MPSRYYPVQITRAGFRPHRGAGWLALTERLAFQGCQTRGEPKTVVAIDTRGYDIEDHSDMDICRQTGRPYYILRSEFIPFERIQLVYQEKARQPDHF